MNPLTLLRNKFYRDTGGTAIFALVVLSLLYFFDEFDTAAFGVLAPNIEHSFHLTDQKFIALITANTSLLILAAIPVGYLADRIRRVPLVIISGILAGLFSFLTGVVGAVALLTVVRLGNGLGLIANGPIHNSLLSDYYPPDRRAPVYATHANAVYVGAIFGNIVAGVMATLFGWRGAFYVLIIPIIITVIFAARLPEPVRGQTDNAEAADEIKAEDPVPFREAARILWNVPTLKRQFIGTAFLGAGVVPLAAYLPLFLQRAFHVAPFGRGVIGSADAAATFVGVLMGGRWASKWFTQSMGEPVRRASYALAATGVGLLLVALSPALWLTVLLGMITSFAIGTFYPSYYAVLSLVIPARVRTLGFSFGALFLVIGVVLLFFFTGLSSVSDRDGIRAGIGVLVPFWLIASAVVYSSARFTANDVSSAFRLLGVGAELRRQRLDAGDRSLLLCTGIDVAYDSVQVLFGVDLEVREGEIVALLGTNGAGKSTLLKAISGLIQASAGAIFFDGADVTYADPRKAVAAGIVQMPGGRSVFPTLTVAECLRLAGWSYKRRDPAHVKAATEQVLEYFPVLRDRWDQLAGNLSGGEQQMLGLGMAFISKPRLLLIDELSLGLAPTIVGRLIEIVRAIHAAGTTIVIVEQSVNVALTLADRAVFMEKGEVRFTGPTADLLGREDILRSVFLEGSKGGEVSGNAPVARSGVAVARTTPLEQIEQRPTLLELTNVSKHFGGIAAVNSVSFSLHRGEILGLIGPNGAGKTTIFDLISGFLSPDSGTIALQAKNVTSWSADRRSWAGLGRSFQDARLFPSLTVEECISVALERHLEFRDPLASALCLPAVAEEEDLIKDKVEELTALLGLEAFRNKFVGELSTGSRRIVDLAMSIAHRPSVLILDEPSSGIAQRETEALGPLLVRIQEETGCSLLIIEHDMPLVTAVSDKMIALELGTVITEGRPGEVIRHPQVVASYLGDNEAAVTRSGSLAGRTVRKLARKATKAPVRKTAVKPAGAVKRSTAAAQRTGAAKRSGGVKRAPKAADAGATARTVPARKGTARTDRG